MEHLDLFCENCGNKVEADEINVKADIAKCKECGHVQKASRLIELRESRQLMIVPPVNSDLDVFRYSDSIMEITSPRKGIKNASQLAPLGFGCFWLGFVGVWTAGAWALGGAFALFSIPFWVVGFGMIYGFSKTAFEKQKIELSGNTMTITKTRILNSKEVVLDLMDIESIEMKGLPANKQVTNMVFYDKNGIKIKKNVGVTVPTITYEGNKKETILDYGTEEEKIWVAQLLKNFVAEVAAKKV
ncbi:MAG: hypothetical protein AAF502_03410 [Bacteroidota bacterium]